VSAAAPHLVPERQVSDQRRTNSSGSSITTNHNASATISTVTDSTIATMAQSMTFVPIRGLGGGGGATNSPPASCR